MRSETFSDDLAAALDRALDARKRYLALVMAAALFAMFLAWWSRGLPGNDGNAALLIALALIAAVLWYAMSRFRALLTATVMPVLLKGAFGWTFRETARNRDVEELSAVGLLPANGTVEVFSDTVGRTGGVFVETWGLRMKARRGKARADYPAYICELPARPDWLGLTIVPTQFRYPLRGAPLDRSGRRVVRETWFRSGLVMTRRGAYPGSTTALRHLVEQTNQLFKDRAAFAGIVFDPDRTRLVIADPSQPLSIGGLFLTREGLLKKLIARLDELSLPLRFASIWGLPKGEVSALNDAPAPREASAEARSAE